MSEASPSCDICSLSKLLSIGHVLIRSTLKHQLRKFASARRRGGVRGPGLTFKGLLPLRSHRAFLYLVPWTPGWPLLVPALGWCLLALVEGDSPCLSSQLRDGASPPNSRQLSVSKIITCQVTDCLPESAFEPAGGSAVGSPDNLGQTPLASFLCVLPTVGLPSALAIFQSGST